jgi:hypothetical protein
MNGGSPGCRGLDTVEPKSGKIERVDECIDRANWVLFVNPVIEAFGKQRALSAIRTFDEALHPIPPKNHEGIIAISQSVFTQPGS